MFNLFKVKSFVIKADEILAFGHSGELMFAIASGNEQERQGFKKRIGCLAVYMC